MVGLAAAALLATALGTLIGALPKMSLPAKSGILTGATCFLSLFAGLYGEPCMQLADSIARAFPITATLNPAKLTTDLFYSLYYYDARWGRSSRRRSFCLHSARSCSPCPLFSSGGNAMSIFKAALRVALSHPVYLLVYAVWLSAMGAKSSPAALPRTPVKTNSKATRPLSP